MSMSLRHEAFQRLSLCMSRPSKLCSQSRHPSRRRQSTAFAPIESASIETFTSDQIQSPTPTELTSTSPRYKIKASVLLSRPPVLTRDLTDFEKAHFLYQRRLNERLALPFSRYFYYPKGTPGDTEWKRKIRERKTPAREIGPYNGYGKDAWNDELLVGDGTCEPMVQIEKLVKDAEEDLKEKARDDTKNPVVERPRSRSTDADKKGEKSSLNRLMTRTLYLLVKGEGRDGCWTFPQNDLLRDESLHKAAERIIVQTGGINMNTWVVGNMPVGHQIHKYDKPASGEEQGIETWGEKTFFMKARIVAGKPNLKDNKFDLVDYQWLAKEEIEHLVEPGDWSAVRNTLAER